jgi:hypothetical protein
MTRACGARYAAHLTNTASRRTPHRYRYTPRGLPDSRPILRSAEHESTMQLAWWRQRRPASVGFLPAVTRSRRAHPHEAARMIHGIDERAHSKGYNVPCSHNALGDRTPLLEAIRGPVSKVKASGAATCANESIPSPHHRVRTTPPERSIGFPCFSPPLTFFPGVSDSFLLAGSSSSGSLPSL